MRAIVITSRLAPYPTMKHPQYLDYDAVFQSLASKLEVHLIGHLLKIRPYAISQTRFSNRLITFPSIWNNRLVVIFSHGKMINRLCDYLDFYSDYLYTRFCLKNIYDKKVDFIYSFPLPCERYPLRVARQTGVPLVIEMWEDYAQFTLESMMAMGIPKLSIYHWVRRTYTWMEDIAKGADRVIVPTMVFMKRLCQLGIEKSKIRVVPVCIRPTPNSDRSLMRRKHNMKTNEKMVFHIGSASPWHDLTTLFESLRYMKSRIIVVISGERPQKTFPAQDFKNIRVSVTGKVTPTELGAYLSAADICVAPYNFHRISGFFPAKVIRYMLAGKSIVATDLPEIREMFKCKPAGIFVPQGDPEALAEAVDRLAENDLIRSKMGMIAKEIAENNYLTSNHTDELIRTFREI